MVKQKQLKTIIKDTVNKYTLLKENLQNQYSNIKEEYNNGNTEDETIITKYNIYKKTLDAYDKVLKQYSHYLN